MNCKISIIVPVYNVESFIYCCIESILVQTFKNIEIILVNDGSTDRSGDICDEFSKKDNRIIVIHKENGGQSSARNMGLDVAKGDFIGFVDSDDWIDRDMYKNLYTKAIAENVDIAACNITKIDQDSTKIKFCHNTSGYLYDRKSAMNELYLNERLTFSPCNKIYNKTLFNDIRFKEGYILEDMDFSYRIIHQSNRLYYTGVPLYNYRYNENSTMRKTFSIKRLDEFEVRKNMYFFYLKNYPDQAKEVYAEWAITGLMLYIKIEKYFRSEKNQYKYLIDIDRNILMSLIFKKKYSRKKKILLSIAVISPNFLVKLYRIYWEKVKNDL